MKEVYNELMEAKSINGMIHHIETVSPFETEMFEGILNIGTPVMERKKTPFILVQNRAFELTYDEAFDLLDRYNSDEFAYEDKVRQMLCECCVHSYTCRESLDTGHEFIYAGSCPHPYAEQNDDESEDSAVPESSELQGQSSEMAEELNTQNNNNNLEQIDAPLNDELDPTKWDFDNFAERLKDF
jgi:hypothetical protein